MSDVLFPGRFRDLADYYATGRPAYPTLLARRVANLVGLNGTQVVLDLGTGPGFLALDYHPFAARVIAVDPEAEMLRVAESMQPYGDCSRWITFWVHGTRVSRCQSWCGG